LRRFSTFSPELLGLKSVAYGDFVMGNVRHDDLASIASSARFQRISRDVEDGIAQCRAECEYFGLCGGGSPSNKYFENGTFASTGTLHCTLSKKGHHRRRACTPRIMIRPGVAGRHWRFGGISSQIEGAADDAAPTPPSQRAHRTRKRTARSAVLPSAAIPTVKRYSLAARLRGRSNRRSNARLFTNRVGSSSTVLFVICSLFVSTMRVVSVAGTSACDPP
jgi:radical SAM protein with 4Fe4S-binding SPASM domain